MRSITHGKVCDEVAIEGALESGHLAGHAGDVGFPPPPPPKDHPWRTMPNHGTTPHRSGTSLSAQHRHAGGVRETSKSFFAGAAVRDEHLVVRCFFWD